MSMDNPIKPTAKPPINTTFLRRLRIFSLVEGISTILLICGAVPLKYLADFPAGVKIMGPVHGLLFVGLLIFFIRAMGVVPLSSRLTLAGIVGAAVPFGPFVVDHWLKRVGHDTGGPADLVDRA